MFSGSVKIVVPVFICFSIDIIKQGGGGMDSFDKSSNKEVLGFIDQWKNHPMSIPIIVLLVTSTFMLILIQGAINKDTITIAIIFCIFSITLLLAVIFVLVKHKFVFYNATELIISEVDRQLKSIQESLANVEIGYGMAFDQLRALPLNADVITHIKNFELLASIVKTIGYRLNINDLTKKALAKYYFRCHEYKKALSWNDQVVDKKDSEYNFIKGLLLWKLDNNNESRKAFDQSEHPNSVYYKYLTYLSARNIKREELDLFIQEAKNENGQLFTNFFSQLHISSAYRKKAFLFSKDDELIDENLIRSALRNTERLFPIDTSGYAHFNAACYLSIIGYYKIEISSERPYDKDKYCTTIIDYLSKALKRNGVFVKLAAHDNDFEWVKSVNGDKFSALIGLNCKRCSGPRKKN
jgi:hypothetical protein